MAHNSFFRNKVPWWTTGGTVWISISSVVAFTVVVLTALKGTVSKCGLCTFSVDWALQYFHSTYSTCTCFILKKDMWGAPVAQLVECVTHIQRSRPRCSSPGFESNLLPFAACHLPYLSLLNRKRWNNCALVTRKPNWICRVAVRCSKVQIWAAVGVQSLSLLHRIITMGRNECKLAQFPLWITIRHIQLLTQGQKTPRVTTKHWNAWAEWWLSIGCSKKQMHLVPAAFKTCYRSHRTGKGLQSYVESV